MAFTFLSAGKRLAQIVQAVRALWANAFGTTWYVDSTNGTDGAAYGLTPDKPLATVGYLITNSKLAAGDTVMLAPGGSETLTATLALAIANVRLICDVDNPEYGYNFVGAGTISLLTVSAAGVKIRGCKISHTGATANANGILTTNGADHLVVDNCLFDDSAITTTFTGNGVNIVNACDNVIVRNCVFKDCVAGVKLTMATGVTCATPKIEDNIFFVGQSAAFGIASALTGTGAVKGMIIRRNAFLEANGNGAVATATWDGTNGTNATQGPIKLEAACDQNFIADNKAFTAAAVTFDNLNAINAGAVSSKIGNKSSTDSDDDLASIIALHAVPTADVTTNTNVRDVVGNKTDAAVSTVGTTKTLMAYLKGLLGLHTVPTADVTTNATITDVVGNKTDAVLTAIAATKSVVAFVKTSLQNIGFLADAAVYAVGTTTGLLAYVKGLLNLSEGIANSATAVMVNNDTIFTVAGGGIEILALVSECVTANDGTASTLQYSVTPTVGSAKTISAASATLANKAAGTTVALQGTALSTAPVISDEGPNLIANPGTVFCPAGTIKLVIGVGSTTGTWKHHLRYKPLAKGVSVS